MKAERRTLPEQVGGAINASHLEHREAREMPVDLLGGVGAAALSMHHGADIENVPIAGARSVVYASGPDERDVIAAELAPLLWHIRFGGQHSQVSRATALFARWIAYRGPFLNANPQVPGPRMMAFSARVLHEWLSDRCPACAGSGKQERTPQGRWVRPAGRGVRNAQLRGCRICGGNGRALPRPAERRSALGMTPVDYDAQRWDQRFNAAHTWLQSNLSRLTRPLTAQLERRKKRV